MKFFFHPEGTKLGKELMAETVEFTSVRITTSEKLSEKENVVSFYFYCFNQFIEKLFISVLCSHNAQVRACAYNQEPNNRRNCLKYL